MKDITTGRGPQRMRMKDELKDVTCKWLFEIYILFSVFVYRRMNKKGNTKLQFFKKC